MDKSKIKSFAIWARRRLIESVSDKASKIGIFENEIKDVVAVQGGFKIVGSEEILPLSKEHRDALVSQIKDKGFEQVMEEVAYTWFNRFMGLRYMEVNEYLPSGIRILSSEVEGKSEPDVLSKVSEIIDELELNGEEIYALLDSGKNQDREKAYRKILVKQCNELGKIIPQMFEKISDYTELLLPDNLLEEGSVIKRMVSDIEEEDWKEEVEIIGWMYQYYISEKKDEVFAGLKKNIKITKENIPAATQLFTPKWIVKYMVENSLGRLWLEGHPNEELQRHWKYYLEEAEQEPEVQEELNKIREEHSKLTPEDLKVLDPCMGSGHILVYAFDVLYEIYKTAGYSEREIPRKILQNNLYGLDIDDRAAQLASFALIMKARHYNRRLFREIQREELDLNLCSIQESNGIGKEAIEYFSNGNKELQEDVEYLVKVFTDAKEYGSILEVEKVNFEAIKERLKEIGQEDNLMFGDYRKMLLEKLPTLVKQAEIISRKYEVCVTNPPYMGSKGMNKQINDYVRKTYPKSKSDLYTVMLERCLKLSRKNGFISNITQQSWMFLTSYESLRKSIITSKVIQNMIHLGPRAFEEIGGEVVQTTTFVIRNFYTRNFESKFIRAIEVLDAKEKERYVSNIIINNNKKIFEVSNNVFINIPNNIIAYWISKKLFEILENEKSLSEFANVRKGLITSDNDRFLRLWHEIDNISLGIGFKSDEKAKESKRKWFPYVKGGKFKKWYGNYEYVLNYYNDGEELKAWVEELTKTKPGGRIINKEYYFKPGITWSSIGTSKTSFRYVDYGSIYSNTGMGIFSESIGYEYLISLLNSKVCESLLNIISPTMGFEAIYLSRIPIKESININIKYKSESCYQLSKNDWDSFETSWDFEKHPLLKDLGNINDNKISSAFSKWEEECENNFNQLKSNEEELNRMFIDIYGLQDELTPDVEDKDVTIRKADRERDIKSFISYAVGCILGRYSIDADGLIYAGGEFKDKWDLENKKVRKIEKDEDGNIISDSWVDATFIPDSDNIIPITEDEYFEDDMVSRFVDFVRTVYGEDTLEENLDFIADSIGRKGNETSRATIRRYFLKDFYKDHLKVYQKRPIYWMFESGKNNGFKALIYMHRYDEQIVAKVRTDYLHTLQRKYEAEIERLRLTMDSSEATAKEKTASKKKIDKIMKQIEECKEYDEVVAYLANEQINIDLDDGVKINYAKFQGVKIINSKNKETKMNLLAKI
ncbi:BREX-1 system adenine-specific DNA-methyltransferase PglX [Clostridium perfringens]|uniref:BREX-1 system adenine-specific DNA-methyltransferase PglX n=1 Tax=Clostridium perfringens TaxID=1502 RepID=UPI0001664E4D|nr:BREX-1 system adenine-specific DNA-methyltransferase PglX [Clostridium perfringens]EDS79975.1 type IIS restriction enzyme [Clostridium perfringens C str. JGS1495]MCI5750626.1 BREX-1 system adenine-specific DNA-methyltransferase PglX [Clostridium perfringens]MDY4419625.1 BREX-1 system adenine-specific DNA-methyltransferase PglX [Clostridium perfringens]NGT47230.1 BREX-1 system adenine-specific DNA-methyltransferase PglX [Clostridium perfringens]NGT77342.1 BREX-1 system adenine-specific DNA-m